MNQPSRQAVRIILIAAAALLLAAIACDTGSTPGSTAVPVGGQTTGGTTGGGTTGGGTTGGGTTGSGSILPTKEPKPAGGGINTSNVADLKEKLTINASQNSLLAGSMSPTEHQAVTYGTDLFVRFWNVDDGTNLYGDLPGHADLGFGLAYSPDGKMVATGGGFQVIFWDTASGKRLRTATPNAQVYRLAFSPDSKTLAVVGEQSSKIDLIDANTGSVTKRVSPESVQTQWAVTYSPDGNLLAVSDNKGKVQVFDSKGGETKWTAQGKGATWDLEFSPDSKLLTACNGSGDITTWNTSDGSRYSSLSMANAHPTGCTDGVYTPSGDVYFSEGADKVLNAWDVKSGSNLFQKLYTIGIWTVSITGDGKLIGLSMDNGEFRILSTE